VANSRPSTSSTGGGSWRSSPTARRAQAKATALQQAPLAAHGLAPAELEAADLENVLLAETKDHADWHLLQLLAGQADDPAVRAALEEAVPRVEAEEDEHLRWARDELAARPNRAEMVEAPREPGLPRRLTAYSRIPSIEHVANITVAGTLPQFVAYYRALIAAGMRYFVVGPDGDPETVRLLAEADVPHLAAPA
jgi:hypothetical protein